MQKPLVKSGKGFKDHDLELNLCLYTFPKFALPHTNCYLFKYLNKYYHVKITDKEDLQVRRMPVTICQDHKLRLVYEQPNEMSQSMPLDLSLYI